MRADSHKSALAGHTRTGDTMKIGLPKALLYYRYGILWETFFRALDCETVTSGDTCEALLAAGSKCAIDENCLPLKIFLGHIQGLAGRCDCILVPRFAKTGRNEEYCVRLWGLPDLVQNTFPALALLTYNLSSNRHGAEQEEFIKLGCALGKTPLASRRAYRLAQTAQDEHDAKLIEAQAQLSEKPGLKILLASQPYLLHDPFITGPLMQMIQSQGGTVLFSDRYNREACRKRSETIAQDLYWTMNRETLGAIAMNRGKADGIILLTAFPCGTDSLVNELVMRRVKDVPMIQLLLDEQQSQTGLETRIESFMDILQQRRAYVQTH